MEKNLPEHEAFGVLRAFTVSAFEELPEPLVYSLADASSDFTMQGATDWKEGVQKHFNGDEINLVILNMNESDTESESYCLVTSGGDVEEEIEGAAAPVEDEKMVIEDHEEPDVAVEEPVEAEEKPEPRSLRQRVMQFVAEIGGEGMQNLVAVAHSLLKEGVELQDALRTAFETSEVAANHPFTQDLLAVLECYVQKFSHWVPMIAQFNIDHVIVLIPNIVDSITRALEGQEDVELNLAPIFQACNPNLMNHLQSFIPAGEERVFQCDPTNPLAVLEEAQESIAEEFETKVVHRGVVCDGCEMDPIVGVRYKSTQRPNFDLCENCEKNHDDNDVLLKFKKPLEEIETLPGVWEFARSVGRGRPGARRGRRQGRGCRFARAAREGCEPHGRPNCRRGPPMMRRFFQQMRESSENNGEMPPFGPCDFFKKMMAQHKQDCAEKQEEPVDRRDPAKRDFNRELSEKKTELKEIKQKVLKEKKQELKEIKKLMKSKKKEMKKIRKEKKKQWKQMKKDAKKPLHLDAAVVGHLDMERESTQKAGTCMLKTWKVKNTGATAWPEETYAVFIGGNESMVVDGYQKVFVGPVEANDVSYIRVMVNIPMLPGQYSVRYRLCTPKEKFGQKMETIVTIEDLRNRMQRTDTMDTAIEEPADLPALSVPFAMQPAKSDDSIQTAVTFSSEPECDIPELIEDCQSPPPPSAPAQPEVQLKFPEQVEQLKMMGFGQDDEILDSLLVVAKGNIAQALEKLM